jgi:hypothetical protein
VRRAPAVLLLALALPAPGVAATSAWQVAVPRPGLVRVPWPAEAPADVAVEVRGPAGEEVASRLVSLAAAERHSARVSRVEAVDGGWELTVDAGPAPPLHQGLRLPLSEAGAASLALEASADGATWRPLAAATLFRLGGDAALQHGTVEYPATDARWLRLRWPADAGFPRLSNVELEVVAGRDHQLGVDPAGCTAAGPRHTRCVLPPAGRPVRALELTLEEGRAAGWRLRRAAAGNWQLLGEGTWTTAAEVPARRIAVTSGADAPLLLDLWGETAAPRVEGLALIAEPLAVELEAGAAGTYRLLPAVDRAAAPPQRPAAREAQWLQPSPFSAPAAEPTATTAGAALPDAPFARSWPVEADASPGEAVRLDLPDEVLATAKRGLEDLRLGADGRQVPFLLGTAEAPERVGVWPGLVPGSGADGLSELELPLAGQRPLATTLVLRTAARPLQRSVRLLHVAADTTAVAAAPPPPGPWLPWHCRPLPPLPCEVVLDVPAGAAGLRVEIADGDDAALPAIEAELWQSRHELRFRWPAAPPTLLAGSPGLAAPRYELGAVDGALLARTHTEAHLGPGGDGPAGPLRRWPRWALLTALGTAAGMLLLVLARALRSPGDQPS